jgi:hypothetical protein
MFSEHDIELDTELNIDPIVRQQANEQTFWSFIETTYPDHVKVLLGTLNVTPQMLEFDVSRICAICIY